MDEERLPNRLLFGELNMKRPCHRAKKRWRDVLKVDLQAIGVYDRWYELCQDRKWWFHLCLDGVKKISTSMLRTMGSFKVCACVRSTQSSKSVNRTLVI